MTSLSYPAAKQVIERFGPEHREVEIGDVVILGTKRPLLLDCGRPIASYPVAYQTYGTLNAARDNMILIFHTLTADQYVAGLHPVTGKPGWWEHAVGPGRPIDTDKYFVLCANVPGGCMGTFGPKTPDANGEPYATSFPFVTARDMARVHDELLELFGVDIPYAIVGPSMGGMIALEWALERPRRSKRVILIACGWRQNPQNIAFNEIGRQAIMADPAWSDGHYLRAQTFPAKGLSVARMSSYLTFMSRTKIEERFGRGLQKSDEDFSFGFDADFQVESYLRYQGASFVKRFDPNSYLYLSRATDYYDLTRGRTRNLAELLTPLAGASFSIFSFTSDWRCPTDEILPLVHAAMAAGVNISAVEVESDQGHDAFLKNEPAFLSGLRGALV